MLLLFGGGGGVDPAVPISELIQTAPLPSHGYPIEIGSDDIRFVLELADPFAAGDEEAFVWHDLTMFYVGDRHGFGADQYMGDNRARVIQVQLQIDIVQAAELGVSADILAPWGQDTSELFGDDVTLDAGLLMRLAMFRVVDGVTVDWWPIWTGKVDEWGDASEARGQIRKHVVTVVDTIVDLANVPVETDDTVPTWQEWFETVLDNAGWVYGVDIYGEQPVPTGGYIVDTITAASVLLDQGSDPLNLTWRSRRDGRMVIHPFPWDTVNVETYPNPLFDVYPSGLVFSYSPDFTDIQYITDDDQQPFGISRSAAGVLNSFAVTAPGDLGPETYLTDDPVSISHYRVQPFTATWIGANTAVVDNMLAVRAFASSQALPLRTTLDHEGFWPALIMVDHLDPVTIIHTTREEGPVVTAAGWVRNVVEERTHRPGTGLMWQSTIQVDVASSGTAEALLPVEDLAAEGFSPALTASSYVDATWTNPTQPSITPTEVQYRVLGQSLIWSPIDYPGVGADAVTINALEAGTYYTLQIRLVRRVNGVITNFSVPRSVLFTTPNRIWPVPIPGTDPTDTDVDYPDPGDCDDMSIRLEENDGTGWSTTDTFSGSEIELIGTTWHLTEATQESITFEEGKVYRFVGLCDGDVVAIGPSFDPPEDWTDPCTTPPALSTPPYDDPDLLVYVPKICAPDIIREAVSGLEATKGTAFQMIGILAGGDPDDRVLLAVPSTTWAAAVGGIIAYGECPQIAGHTGDKTILARVYITDDTEACVLFECAGMTLKVVPAGGGWRASVVVYTLDSTTTVPTASILDVDTEYWLAATFELATGDVTIFVNGVESNAIAGVDDEPTVNTLPIWRVGAPPSSWITDCAIFDRVLLPSELPHGEWTPEDLGSDLRHWWDAADPATLTLSGSTVDVWADKGTENEDLIGPAPANSPDSGLATLNGLNVLQFNGGQYVEVSGIGSRFNWMHNGTKWGFAIAVKQTDATGGHFATMDGGPESGYFAGAISSTLRSVVNATAGTRMQQVSSSGWSTSWHVVSAIVDPGNATAALRGFCHIDDGANIDTNVSTGAPDNNNPGGSNFIVGAFVDGTSAASPMTGEIAEIVICDMPADGTDAEARRVLIKEYLQARWGL